MTNPIYQSRPLFVGQKINPEIRWADTCFLTKIGDLFRTVQDFWNNNAKTKRPGLTSFKFTDILVNLFTGKPTKGGVNDATLTKLLPTDLRMKAIAHDASSLENSLKLSTAIIPIAVDNHMITLVKDGDTITVYDPQGSNLSKRKIGDQYLIDVLRKYKHVTVMTDAQGNVPKHQRNLIDCGVIAIDFCRYLSKTKNPLSYQPTFEKSSAARLAKREELAEQVPEETVLTEAQKRDALDRVSSLDDAQEIDVEALDKNAPTAVKD